MSAESQKAFDAIELAYRESGVRPLLLAARVAQVNGDWQGMMTFADGTFFTTMTNRAKRTWAALAEELKHRMANPL